MVYYVQAEIFCSQLSDAGTSLTSQVLTVNDTAIDCFPYVDTGTYMYSI